MVNALKSHDVMECFIKMVEINKKNKGMVCYVNYVTGEDIPQKISLFITEFKNAV